MLHAKSVDSLALVGQLQISDTPVKIIVGQLALHQGRQLDQRRVAVALSRQANSSALDDANCSDRNGIQRNNTQLNQNLLPKSELGEKMDKFLTHVRRIEVLGYIVRQQWSRKGVEFTIDDSTGLLTCMLWTADESAAPSSTSTSSSSNPRSIPKHRTVDEALADTRVGLFVRVRGKLREWRDFLVLTVEFVVPESDLNAQALHWAESMANQKILLQILGNVDTF